MSIEKVKSLAKQEVELQLKEQYEQKLKERDDIIEKMLNQEMLEHHQLALLSEKRDLAIRASMQHNFDAEFAKMKNTLETEIAKLVKEKENQKINTATLNELQKQCEVLLEENNQLRNEVAKLKIQLDILKIQ